MAASPAPDQLVVGRYRWREQLGRGGFGVVWRAHDTLLQRDVAVKVIEFPPILDDEERAAIRKKVLREARAAARLSHPGLVTVFDVIEEDGRPLIVMELVKAPTLAAVVERDGPLPDARVATIGLAVLDALEVAHRQGIIHRDVKPANVMVSESGLVQLTDFGIASIVDDPRVTSSGALVGSPSYMSPEQARNQPATAATDLWGLGTTLYFAAEGEPPFRRDGAIATLTAVVNEPHRPPRRSSALTALIEEMLAKDPTARPTTAQVRRRLTDVADASPAASVDPTATIDFDPRADWADTPLPEVGTVAAPKTAPPAAAAEALPSAPRTEAAPPPAAEAVPPAARTEEPPAWTEGAPPAARTEAAEPPARAETAPPPAVAEEPPARTRARRDNRSVLVAGVVGVAVVAVVVLALVAGRHRSSSDASGPATSAATPSTAGSKGPTTVKGGSKAPAGWVAYSDPTTGFTIAHPPGWTVSTNGTLTDFRDPASRAYLRVDHREPPGSSPEGAWYDFEPGFAAQNADYHRLQITPTTFSGYRAAVWEYTYSGGGAPLHAVDLGFIVPGHGFALNFQTADGDWDRLQSVFDGFKASFRAPSS